MCWFRSESNLLLLLVHCPVNSGPPLRTGYLAGSFYSHSPPIIIFPFGLSKLITPGHYHIPSQKVPVTRHIVVRRRRAHAGAGLKESTINMDDEAKLGLRKLRTPTEV
ncbi:Hypothetical protein NTJ_05398 [Nesidiocoris tenuis]|uniref:Uncharacterized protein n=1 Tax=Nesidiocoris tenuis TaxID=355587 RepID=A0ABN7AKT9_9HEMI|nr:Hypothetical protein NTJ_05398 [Nesidiocoris tenuis]